MQKIYPNLRRKTKNIRLVLVTAILTSCNRMILPDRPETGDIPDSSVTDTTYCSPPCADFNFYYTGPPYAYYPRFLYRQKAFWHHHTFIIRRGFGRSATSRTSTAAS